MKTGTIEKNMTDISAADLALINQYTLRECGAGELFVFRGVACDNEIDRDYEAFSTAALRKLAGMFVGKTVLSEPHVALPEYQCARVYSATVERDGSKRTSYGEPYEKLVVRCYIPRVEEFEELIPLIETGIRKELSVGCRVGKHTCSICGLSYWSSDCEHHAGARYSAGKKCFVILEDPEDAFEVSFVAIPAQPSAGVSKAARGDIMPELHGIMTAVKGLAKSIRCAPGPAQSGAGVTKSYAQDDPEVTERQRKVDALLAECDEITKKYERRNS